MVGIGVPTAVAIGDGIALKQDARPVGKRRHWFPLNRSVCAAAGLLHQQGGGEQSPHEAIQMVRSLHGHGWRSVTASQRSMHAFRA
jgi:hypothetical protein